MVLGDQWMGQWRVKSEKHEIGLGMCAFRPKSDFATRESTAVPDVRGSSKAIMKHYAFSREPQWLLSIPSDIS